MRISSKAMRLFQTANLNLTVFCMGVCISCFGATLLDLAEIYQTTTNGVSYTLTTRAVGSILGGLIGEFVYRWINGQIVLLMSSLTIGIGLILTPLMSNLIYLHMTNFMIGASLSFIEIGSHVWFQILWKEKSGPVFQLFNLIFGIGGIIAPLVCEPFLSSQIQGAEVFTENILKNSTIPSIPQQSDSRIAVAFAILGSIFIVNVIGMVISFIMDSTNPRPEISTTAEKETALPKKIQYILVLLSAAYMLVGVACEVALSTYMPSFVVRSKYLKFTKSSAAYLSSVFWTSFTVGRVVATGLIFVMSITKIMILFHAILMGGTVFMVLFVRSSPLIAWIGTATIGFGLSPYFGNATVWITQYLKLTHGYMSFMTVCFCTSASLPSLLIGTTIDSNPMIMMYVHTSLASILTICAVVMLFYGRSSLLRTHLLVTSKELRNADELETLKNEK